VKVLFRLTVTVYYNLLGFYDVLLP
jgi:hypothetical protein